MPAALMTLPHFFASSIWNLASASGEVGNGSPPLVSKKAFAAGVFSAAVSVSCSLLMTGAYVPAGT